MSVLLRFNTGAPFASTIPTEGVLTAAPHPAVGLAHALPHADSYCTISSRTDEPLVKIALRELSECGGVIETSERLLHITTKLQRLSVERLPEGTCPEIPFRITFGRDASFSGAAARTGVEIASSLQALDLRSSLVTALTGHTGFLALPRSIGHDAFLEKRLELFSATRALPEGARSHLELVAGSARSESDLEMLIATWSRDSHTYESVSDAMRDLSPTRAAEMIRHFEKILTAADDPILRGEKLLIFAHAVEEEAFVAFFNQWLPEVPDDVRGTFEREVQYSLGERDLHERLLALFDLRERVCEELPTEQSRT